MKFHCCCSFCNIYINHLCDDILSTHSFLCSVFLPRMPIWQCCSIWFLYHPSSKPWLVWVLLLFLHIYLVQFSFLYNTWCMMFRTINFCNLFLNYHCVNWAGPNRWPDADQCILLTMLLTSFFCDSNWSFSNNVCAVQSSDLTNFSGALKYYSWWKGLVHVLLYPTVVHACSVCT